MTPRAVAHQGSDHGILQARILEWVAISFSGVLPNPEIELVSLASPKTGRTLPMAPPGKPVIEPLPAKKHTL